MSGQECPLQHIQIYGFVFHRWLHRTFQMNNAAHIMPNRIYHGTIRIPKPKSINTTSQFDWDGSSVASVLGSFRRIIMLDVVKSPCTISASCAAVKIKYLLVEMKCALYWLVQSLYYVHFSNCIPNFFDDGDALYVVIDYIH